jgi:hypothetical protein
MGLYRWAVDDPRELMAGPRGRRMSLELSRLLARAAATEGGQDYLRAAFLAAHTLEPRAGASWATLVDPAAGDREAEPAPGPAPAPAPAPDEVARLLDAVPRPRLDGRILLDALAAAVDAARYWQEPDGDDLLAATSAMHDPLSGIAASAAASMPAWWAAPLDRTAQWIVDFDDRGMVVDDDPAALHAPTAIPARERLSRWRAHTMREETRAQGERPVDPRASFSGTWWSTPPSDLARTTRGLGPLGPAGLWLVEDAFSWTRAVARPMAVPEDPAVYEVDGPDAWADLCRRFPLDVTASRRHDWYRATGMARRWVLPDWSRVAEQHPAIHLTVAGYLTTAGRPLPATDDSWCLLAGWNPDETCWLSDVDDARWMDGQSWVRSDDSERSWTLDTSPSESR